MNEAAINRKIQKLIEKEGGYVIKTIATNRAGVPDILACIRGKFIAIEGKTETGVVSALQKAHIAKIQKAGGIAIVARKPETVQLLLESLAITDLLEKQ